MTNTPDRETARAFFIAYFGPRPKGTSHRQYAASCYWCRVNYAFLDPEGSLEAICAAREAYQRKQREGDPLSGMAYTNLKAAEAAEEKARELRGIYEQTIATGELPEYWRGYTHRPGARLAAHRFEQFLAEKMKPQTSEQPTLFC